MIDRRLLSFWGPALGRTVSFQGDRFLVSWAHLEEKKIRPLPPPSFQSNSKTHKNTLEVHLTATILLRRPVGAKEFT